MHDDDDDLTPEDVERVVQAAVGELLNLAAGVADLQTTDEAAEEILVMCDLVAEYMGIERAELETVENSDGSYTTRIKNAPKHTARTEPIPGHIRTMGKLKYRVVDSNKPLDDLNTPDE